ncbi:neural cell adhesion molecule 1-like [Ptychodera flava]|uniref:neural cell adhesion molecule 1-like n=1 Tax=Ptychodera flava TaxID=63121 RepID=UPI003969EA0D
MTFSVIGIWLLLPFCQVLRADGKRVVAEKWISPLNDTTIVMKNGQSAKLPCAVNVTDDDSGWPRWSQVSPLERFVAAGTTVDPIKCPNCEIVGDHSKGEYNLLIKDALANTDEGQWECRMFEAIPNSLNVELILLDENLTCSVEPIGPGYTIISGENMTLTCDLNKAPPPGELAWTVNGNDVIASTNGTLIWEATFNETNKDDVYTCTYRYRTLVEPVTCENDITFNIQYCPKYVMIHHENGGKVKEFDSFFATCYTNSNPAANYTWYDPSGQVFTAGPNLTIDIIDRTYSGTYLCEAATALYDNTQCNKSSTIHVDVQYPIKVTTPQSVESLVGDDLNVTCQVSANPAEDSVEWFRGSKLMSDNSQLIIDDIRRQDAGTHHCNSTNTLYDGSVFSQSSATVIHVECHSQWVNIPADTALQKMETSLSTARCVEMNPTHPDGHSVGQ